MQVGSDEWHGLIRTAILNGRALETGFEPIRQKLLQIDAVPDQITDMRIAFMAGASFLFDTVMRAIEETDEDDMTVFESLSTEISSFGEEIDSIISSTAKVA